MIAYADAHMPHQNGKIRLVLFDGQNALQDAATQSGYHRVSEATDMQFDFHNALDYPLPEGFHFVKAEHADMKKVDKCCWKGFDHEKTEGTWKDEDDQNGYLIWTAPHATAGLSVIIADEKEEYACLAGMWWTPKNRLAYMEPLCTIPQYRNRGLASAALSELYRRTKRLGATHMTGGMHEFYAKIGYEPAVKWTFWEKINLK
ncbi:MAG TPA: hypothetical protein DF613_12900 [Lachnospiraceae bacterium]|nr:hypothetical protein [Lachnospiraceae bacterium]